MDLRVVTKADTMEKVAERCESSSHRQVIACLREAYEVLYGPRTSTDGSVWRVFDQMINALAFNEVAILLIPPGWLRSVADIQGGGCRAELYNPAVTHTSSTAQARAETWPLAICAAAMRVHARLYQEEE